MIDLKKGKLEEKMLLFLYILSEMSVSINLNTFKRYLYLYFLTSSFLFDEKNDIDFTIEKGDVNIINFDSALSDFIIKEYISLKDNEISVNPTLTEFAAKLVENPGGTVEKQYKEIKPFINLLQSYDDQFVFTIFFCEPTFDDATKRNLNVINSSDSKLSELLSKFKEKIKDSKIDEYDILTYWMDYILKNYYSEVGESYDEG